mgnify:CR=1 FL=1
MSWDIRKSSNRPQTRAENHRNEEYCKKLRDFYNNANSRTFEIEMLRARMLIFYYEGNSARKVASEFGVSYTNILQLSRKFEEEGLIGLSNKPARDKIKLLPQEKEVVLDYLASCEEVKMIDLVDFVEENFKKDYSASSKPMLSLLHKAGFSYDYNSKIWK